MKRLALALLIASACSRGYLSVTVTAAQPLASEIVQLSVSAFDATGADSGPSLLPPSGLLDGGLAGLPDASLTFTLQAPSGSDVTVGVAGLNSDGQTVAKATGSDNGISAASHLTLTLQAACTTDRDCANPDGVCQGTVSCTQGVCTTVSSTSFLAAGSPCGPCDAGHCDGMGSCLLADCGCLQRLADGGQGFLFNPAAGEQCDDGPANSNTTPNACRTDCHFPSCGDGVVDSDYGEICDLGANNGKGLGCNATCNLFGHVLTIAGSGTQGTVDGTGKAAQFDVPNGIALYQGQLYVTDTLSRAVRQVDPSSGAVLTIAGGVGQMGSRCSDTDGVGMNGTFCDDYAILAVDGGLLVSDDSAMRTLSTNGAVGLWAGQLGVDGGGPPLYPDSGPFFGVGPNVANYGVPRGIAQLDGIIYTTSEFTGDILASDPATQLVLLADLVPGNGGMVLLGGIAAVGNQLYTAQHADPGLLWVLPPFQSGSVSTAAEISTTLGLHLPNGVCADGRSIYICEQNGNAIRQYDTDAGTLTLVAGSLSNNLEADGWGADAGLYAPAGCTYDPVARRLYVVDQLGNTVRVIE